MSFTAIVEKFGTKSSYRGEPIPTILLKNVKVTDTNELVTGHLWFSKGKSWSICTPGSKVTFYARVTPYEKGYRGHREDVYSPTSIDYKLERPTKVAVITSTEVI